MSLDNTSQPSVKYCADKVNARYIHGRPEFRVGSVALRAAGRRD